MQVEMVDRLAPISAAVEHQSVAVGEAESAGQLSRHENQVANGAGVACLQMRH